jgi:hypothetical protein
MERVGAVYEMPENDLSLRVAKHSPSLLEILDTPNRRRFK